MATKKEVTVEDLQAQLDAEKAKSAALESAAKELAEENEKLSADVAKRVKNPRIVIDKKTYDQRFAKCAIKVNGSTVGMTAQEIKEAVNPSKDEDGNVKPANEAVVAGVKHYIESVQGQNAFIPVS